MCFAADVSGEAIDVSLSLTALGRGPGLRPPADPSIPSCTLSRCIASCAAINFLFGACAATPPTHKRPPSPHRHDHGGSISPHSPPGGSILPRPVMVDIFFLIVPHDPAVPS